MYDNACVVLPFSIEEEEVYLNTYHTFEEAGAALFNMLSLGITAEA